MDNALTVQLRRVASATENCSWRRFGGPGQLARGGTFPLSWWLLLLCYVFGPLIVGLLVGHGVRRKSTWAMLVAGRQRAPRAWDELFVQGGTGIVRLKLKSERDGHPLWLAGWYGVEVGQATGSRAAGYPEAQDLYLAPTVACDERTGELTIRNGDPIVHHDGLLVRWEEVEYLYFMSLRARRSSSAVQKPAYEMEGTSGAETS